MVRARILNESEMAIACDAIKNGDIVAIPTETVYGLAGDAFNAAAVTKIFAAKERPSFDPLIVHVSPALDSVEQLASHGIIDQNQMTPDVMEMTNRLIDKFWPGPLTIILPRGHKIPDIVTSGLASVGVRMPSHPLAQKLLTICGTPLAAPSANRFGRISPTQSSHVLEELGDRIDFVLEGGPSAVGVESTVIAVGEEPDSPKGGKARIWILRPGKISLNELQAFSSSPITAGKTEHEKASPGMLMSHYAPMKPMLNLNTKPEDQEEIRKRCGQDSCRIGLLVPFGNGSLELNALTKLGCKALHTIILSPTSDDQEAAQNLFAAMRKLDALDIDLIIAGPIPTNSGLWAAISDRLKRASSK